MLLGSITQNQETMFLVGDSLSLDRILENRRQTDMRMKKMLFILVVVLLIVVAVVFVVKALNPLRRSSEQIRENMLQQTPIGTSMEDVIKVIESHEKWKIDYVANDIGYSMMGGAPGDASDREKPIIGKKSIRAVIGAYTNFFNTTVTSYWGFDENSKLVNLHIHKDTDGF